MRAITHSLRNHFTKLYLFSYIYLTSPSTFLIPTSTRSGNTQDQWLSQVQIRKVHSSFKFNNSFILSHSFLAEYFLLLPLSSDAPPPLVTMTDDAGSDISNTQRAKRARLPRLQEARPRKTPAQQNAVTDMSSVLSVQRSNARKLTTQEREQRRQTSSKEPSPYEDPLPAEDLSPPLDLASMSSSTEVLQNLKRKCVNTTRVSLIYYI